MRLPVDQRPGSFAPRTGREAQTGLPLVLISPFRSLVPHAPSLTLVARRDAWHAATTPLTRLLICFLDRAARLRFRHLWFLNRPRENVHPHVGLFLLPSACFFPKQIRQFPYKNDCTASAMFLTRHGGFKLLVRQLGRGWTPDISVPTQAPSSCGLRACIETEMSFFV